MNWALQPLRLGIGLLTVWHVDAKLVSFDASLSRHLRNQLYNDPDFQRRIDALENKAIGVGRNIPARKFLTMIAHRVVRDSESEKVVLNARWDRTLKIPDGNVNLQGGVDFLEELEQFLADADGLIAEQSVVARVVEQISRTNDPKVKRFVSQFKELHPNHDEKRW